MEEAIALGRIVAPGFFFDPLVRYAWLGCQWVGDGPGSIDPLKEVGAARERVALGISTLAEETMLHDGGDWELKHAQRVKEEKLRQGGRARCLPRAASPPSPRPRLEGRRRRGIAFGILGNTSRRGRGTGARGARRLQAARRECGREAARHPGRGPSAQPHLARAQRRADPGARCEGTHHQDRRAGSRAGRRR